MPKPSIPRSWAEQLADLEDPAPEGIVLGRRCLFHANTCVTDFDPEDDVEAGEDSDEDDASTDGGEGREHYVDVGYVFCDKLVRAVGGWC